MKTRIVTDTIFARSLAALGAILAASFVAAPVLAQDPDVRGSRDYADLPRVDGGRIRAYRTYDNAEILIPQAGIHSRSDESEKTLKLQGAVRHSDYVIRPLRPAHEIDRYYETALRNGGYETVFTCSGISICGSRMGSLILNEGVVSPVGFADGLFNDRLQVRVARKGSTWVLLHMIQGPDRALVYQAVIEGARELE